MNLTDNFIYRGSHGRQRGRDSRRQGKAPQHLPLQGQRIFRSSHSFKNGKNNKTRYGIQYHFNGNRSWLLAPKNPLRSFLPFSTTRMIRMALGRASTGPAFGAQVGGLLPLAHLAHLKSISKNRLSHFARK